MRDYVGILVNDVADASLRDKLAKVDYFLRDLSKGIGRIERGKVPDGSGKNIGDTVLSDIYLVLKGRPGNQIAHGGTGPAGSLTLSSTNSGTKGLIYLGESKGSGWDETNSRLGVGTVAATAKVHIKVLATSNQLAHITAVSASDAAYTDQGGLNTSAAIVAALGETSPDDATYVSHARQGSSLSLNFGPVTNPGIYTGHKLKFRCAVPAASGPELGYDRVLVNMYSNDVAIFTAANRNFPSDGVTYDVNTTTSPATAGMTAGYQTYSYTLGTAEASAITDYSKLRVDWIYYTGLSTTATYRVSWLEFEVPTVGGIVGDTLQKWEDPTNSNTLVYVTDGNNNDSLVLQGTRTAVSASAWAMTVGSPASGMIAASKDAIGTVTWASASSLATRVQHRFVANGPYRAGDETDGVYIPVTAMTLSKARLYRRVGGTAGSTQVNLTKNGVSMLSAPISIAFNAGASATADGTINVTTMAAGDRIAASAVVVDTGLPRDAGFSLEFEAY